MAVQKIVILIASVRQGRLSNRVGLYFEDLIKRRNGLQPVVTDLMELQFSVFNERLKFMKDIPPAVADFAAQIKEADGVIIVTPEYNGGYPASLKNVIDLLYDEWKRKPVAITTVSSGAFGGSQVITSLLFTLWKIGAWVVPAMFPVPKVAEAVDENGKPSDEKTFERRASAFLDELVVVMQARRAVGV